MFKTSDDKIRAFIAVGVSNEAKLEIKRIIELLCTANVNAKWIEIKNIHVTLKFLGSVEKQRLKDLVPRLQKIAQTIEPFEITLSEIGTFPKNNDPKVIWIGIEKNKAMLEKLYFEIDKAVKEEGLACENRKFKPHVTLCRIKNSEKTSKLREIIDAAEIRPVPSTISEMILFRSRLTPQGAIHTPVLEFSFK